MSKSQTCKNCKYFHRANNSLGPPGSCQRFPPVPMVMPQPTTVLGSGNVGMAGVHPPVIPDHTCGEYHPIDGPHPLN